MFNVSESEKILATFLDEQKIIEDINYRPFFYTHSVECGEGLLVVNLITKEKIWLTDKEKEFFEHTECIENVTVQTLIKKWFLVPIDFDDRKFAEGCSSTKKMLISMNRSDIITSFTIFTTTDCNARCFYCFEHGSRRINMTDKTAEDVADFIIKKSNGHKVQLRWFGGEPLFNTNPIDIISKKLMDNNIRYNAKMVSNGYLFDDKIIEKAKNEWHLTGVQITLDGLEQAYNRIKSFVYKDDVSPFIKVTDNIEALLKANIAVNIRLNFNDENINDIRELVPYLINRYKRYPNCRIPIVVLNDIINPEITDDAKYKYLCETQREITKLLQSNGMIEPKKILKDNSSGVNCMANDDKSTTILPDGKLGKCEHYLDDNFWGSIYSDEVDYKMIASFKEYKPKLPQCNGCKWEYNCGSLNKCEALKNYCNDYEIFRKERVINDSLIWEYKKLINKSI